MIQSFRLSLYDFFGFLLPGVIALISAILLAWAVCFPRFPIPIQHLPTDAWIVAGLSAYFAGHLIQAIGNALTPLLGSAEEKIFGATADAGCGALTSSLKAAVGSWGIEASKLTPHWLYRICDETVAQRGVVADREIFVYREGFYRGTFVALALLSLALVVRIACAGATVEFRGSVVQVPISLWLLMLCTCVAGSWMACARFRRFALHRVSHALAGFTVLQGTRSDASRKEVSRPAFE